MHLLSFQGSSPGSQTSQTSLIKTIWHACFTFCYNLEFSSRFVSHITFYFSRFELIRLAPFFRSGHQQNEQTQQKRPMTALYSRVFRAMLVLSCDADQVPRQLFLPLTYQVIHWFTNNRTFEHPYTSSLLQTIMVGYQTNGTPLVANYKDGIKVFMR